MLKADNCGTAAFRGRMEGTEFSKTLPVSMMMTPLATAPATIRTTRN